MILWIGLLVFSIPLYFAIKEMRKSNRQHDKRLQQIQQRLREIEEDKD